MNELFQCSPCNIGDAVPKLNMAIPANNATNVVSQYDLFNNQTFKDYTNLSIVPSDGTYATT